jgi:hypothetical protein
LCHPAPHKPHVLDTHFVAWVGITLQLKPYPAGDYYRLYGGNQAFVKANTSA